MEITNNGGGNYCVGSEEAGKMLLNLKPGENTVDQADWDKCKDRPVIKAAVRSGRIVPGGNPGAPPSKAHIVQFEDADRQGMIDSGRVKTSAMKLVEAAAQEKADFEAHPTLGLVESSALSYIATCEDKAILEACYAAFENGKDTRLAVKEALLKRAAELDEASNDGGDDDSNDSDDSK